MNTFGMLPTKRSMFRPFTEILSDLSCAVPYFVYNDEKESHLCICL